MIRLVTTNDKLQLVLGGAVTTDQLQCVVNFSERSAADYVGGSTRSNSNDTTDVDICAAPGASNYRDIDGIHVHNLDTVLATVTIKIDVSGTEHIIWKGDLNPGDNLFWSRTTGWQVTDNLGRVKTAAYGIGGSSSDDKHYVHTQGSAATTWTVNHLLGKKPAVTVVTSGDVVVEADVSYIDDNSLSVNFSAASSGKVYCN